MSFIIVVLTIIGVWILSVLAVGYFLSAPAYQGPVTDHFDGKKFNNLNGVQAKGFKEIIKWLRQGREKRIWAKDETPSKIFDLPTLKENQVRVSFVNHSTFLIEIAGLRILTDPIWSNYASPFQFAGPKRMKQPGFTIDSLGKVDYVLLTHNHYDHLDLPALKKIQQLYHPEIVTTLGVDLFLRKKGFLKVSVLDWWESKTFGQVNVTATPTQHFSSRGLFDRDRSLWCGFTIKTSDHHIYYAGDSGYGTFFKAVGERLGPFDLSMIPIGAYKPEWFMQPIHVNPAQAVQIHFDAYSKKSIACHFGTFPLADDSMSDPIEDLNTELEKREMNADDFVVLDHGENIVID